MRKGWVAAIAIGAITAVLAGSALAAKTEVREPTRKLTLHNTETGVYDGAVFSDDEDCEARRTVRVFHDENNNKKIDSKDFEIGHDRTNGEGDYEVVGNQAPPGDSIIARVEKRHLSDDTLCLSAVKKATARGSLIPA